MVASIITVAQQLREMADQMITEQGLWRNDLGEQLCVFAGLKPPISVREM